MKKLLIFLMMALPIVAILVLNLTISVVRDTVSIPVQNIELQEETVISNIGESYALKTTIYPINATNKTLVWESSDTSVVQVDMSGNLFFVGFGSAYITVTSLDGNQKASCYFVVTDTVVHQVLIYTVDDVNKVKVGQELQVYAAVIPSEAINKNISFTSSNLSVAEIDSQGRLTGISAGTTTIVATSEDGGKMASMDIEVYEGITSMLLSNYALTEVSFYQLNPQLTPSNADITKINFSVDKPEIATVNQYGRVVFLQAGTVTVTAVYEDLIQTCEIEYTNGYASSLNVSAVLQTVNYSDITWQIPYNTTPTNLYNTHVSFSSSDASVATVNDTGLVTLEGGGFAVVSLSVYKSDGERITKDITLFVERDAEEIVGADFVTALSSTQIQFTTLPEDNTNSNFYFHLDSSIASVNQNGVITFNQSGIVQVTIFANSDLSNVYKIINVEYTGGYAKSFNVSETIEVEASQSLILPLSYIPQNTQIKNLTFEILSQTANDGSQNNVISVLQNGQITGLKGGFALLRVSLQVGISTYLTRDIEVSVVRYAQSIDFEINLEKLNDEFVTGNQVVTFSASVLPLDSSNKTIVYTVDNTAAATINGNDLIFNYPSVVTLTAYNLASSISKSVIIRYTTTVLKVDFSEFVTSIFVGESFNVNVINHIPSNLSAEITLQKTSEITKINGSVVLITGNNIIGLNGGTANISVYVAGVYKAIFTINVIRNVASIDVYPKNIQITGTTLNLNYTISPIDSTSNSVVWHIDNPEIASISNGILTFNDYGIVEITATVQDANFASITFTIERSQPELQNISPSEQEIELFVGEYVQIQQGDYQNQYQIIQSSSESVITVSEDGLIRALSAGSAILRTMSYNQYGIVVSANDLNISVFNYISDISLSDEIFHFYNGEFLTAMANNNLLFSLYPSQNVKQNITFELLTTSIAIIENSSLNFYAEGVVQLKATSQDNFVKIWTIRYTSGYAFDAELNVPDTLSLQKGQSITIGVAEWIPHNTLNKNITIQILDVNNSNYISLNGTTIIANAGGTVSVLVRISDIITKTLTINVIEEIEQIIFDVKSVLIAETTYVLSPRILPSTATSKNVTYVLSNPNIATIIQGVVIFSLPGTVTITVSSQTNPSVSDFITITSTSGYPNKINLNTYHLSIMENDFADIIVTSYSPSSVGEFNLIYTIQSNNPFDNVGDTISVSSAGKVAGLKAGSATIKVGVENVYGLDIFELVTVEVIPQITGLNVLFDNLDLVNGIYLTGINQVDFEVILLPNNSSTQNYTYTLSNQTIATINSGKLNFLQTGAVSITFTSTINTNIKKTVTVNFTNNKYVSVTVNENGFAVIGGVKQTSAFAGTIFNFEILTRVPKNITSDQISITQISTVPNVSSLGVSEVINNQIHFKNGGTVVYNLNINGFNLGNYTFVVVRMAQSISTFSSVVYVSVPSHTISASVMPADTTDKSLVYTSSNTSIATVNINGQVEFLSVGEVNITIRNNASGIQRTINITYTRQVQSISFAQIKTDLSVNSTVLLQTQIFPSDIGGTVIKYLSNNSSIATVDSSGRVITYNNEGLVTITAYVEGNSSVNTTITFSVIKYITNIALELDSVGDNRGIAGTRVFGTQFINDSSGEFYNTYKMNVLSKTPSDSHDTLNWFSSNSEIATVNDEGVVTFVKAGTVTIRVEPKNQYNLTRPVFDSYTFKVVEGANIYNFNQFMIATNEAMPIVFQANAVITPALITKFSITEVPIFNNYYGNGYMLSLSGLNVSQNKMALKNNGIEINNLTIRGQEMTSSSVLSDLSGSGSLIVAWDVNDIVIKNSILENAHILIRAFSSKIFIAGSIFQNSGYAHIVLSRILDEPKQTVITVKNAIFKDAVIGALMFDFDQSADKTYASKLILQENIYIYNYRQPSEMLSENLLQIVPEVLRGLIIANVDGIFSFLNNIKHTYNGKTYYHIGIVMLNMDYYLGKSVSPGIVDTTQMINNPYRENIANLNIAGVTADATIYTIMPGNPSITPDSTYNSSIYPSIREN